ncbi:unnamed protein product [Withania somnifera]
MEIYSLNIDNILTTPKIREKIKLIYEKLAVDICLDHPSAFWNRKRHIVTLPYEETFNEENIPTKSRPTSNEHELVEFCKKEIDNLLQKGLIKPSKSPWSCTTFYSAFNVPFGQYEWNVMPFGLKNAPSEFRKIINDIFNQYMDFIIVYIDDILVYSKTLESHIKHLDIFKKIVIQNGLVISKPKMNTFQTNVRFLGHNICQGKIIPIQRSIEFASKFPDIITDRTMLQRFLGGLNYISPFYKNLSKDLAPLYERLKNHKLP